MSNETNKTSVELISLEESRPFIEKWHYSGVVPTGQNIFFGWYDNTGKLYAVADYGIGVNPYQAPFLSRITGFIVENKNLLELKRLCRVEPKQNKPLTRFLSLCHKKLKKMGYKYVVSFSDPEEKHNGGIYKAANFLHLGQTNPEMHLIDKDGNKRHRRYAYRHARRNGIHVSKSREILGVSPVKTMPKDRWFLKIAKARRVL